MDGAVTDGGLCRGIVYSDTGRGVRSNITILDEELPLWNGERVILAAPLARLTAQGKSTQGGALRVHHYAMALLARKNNLLFRAAPNDLYISIQNQTFFIHSWLHENKRVGRRVLHSFADRGVLSTTMLGDDDATP